MTKSIILWFLTIIIALSTMVYQRLTGPTYPKKVELSLNDTVYQLNLLRSNEIGTPCEIRLPIADKNITGNLIYKRYNTNDSLTTLKMNRKMVNEKAFFGEGPEIEVLYATLPEQPAAGKIEYFIELSDGEEIIELLKDNPVVLRFKGYVPRYILTPHIIFMILSLIFGVRAGIEAIFSRKRTLRYVTITLISLGIGGLFLGPVVQFNAFGEYWTGWPFGSDWTDNKTLFAFIFWIVAFFQLRKNPKNRLWPLIALTVLFSVYLIPHSMGGSELNPETGQIETGLKK
ncbi:MAG: hypothetical protein JXR34_10435 [Bacteroidales bacterium]|nr:hypothetical protein [Bacteroidales bacterium]